MSSAFFSEIGSPADRGHALPCGKNRSQMLLGHAIVTPISAKADELPARVVSLDHIYVVAGLIGLFFGGEALVRRSVGIARRMAMPPMLIGLTVMGVGTSTP
jgi:Ca2+/Na+ antiporter